MLFPPLPQVCLSISTVDLSLFTPPALWAFLNPQPGIATPTQDQLGPFLILALLFRTLEPISWR